MSAATEQKNGDVVAVVEKEDLKKPAVEEKPTKTPVSAAVADNGTASKDDADFNPTSPFTEVKGTKRPSDAKYTEPKKAKKDSESPDGDSDGDSEEEVLEEITVGSDIESDEYDIPYDGEEDDVEDDDDDNEGGSGSDDQA